MPRLADRWRLIAPDLPGFGYSDTPDVGRFDYSFSGYTDFLLEFAGRLGLDRSPMADTGCWKPTWTRWSGTRVTSSAV